MTQELTTAQEVLRALNGVPAAAELTGADYKAAFAWKMAGRFPSRYFLIMSQELERRGYTAPPSLWSMVESERAAS